MLIKNVNIERLLKAFKTFKQFYKHTETWQLKAGAVKSFEYTYEMSWKTMKKILMEEGINALTPRDVFRQAARSGLINDPEVWFTFLEKRNFSSHAYDEDEIDVIVDLFDQFAQEVTSFLKNIGVPDDQY